MKKEIRRMVLETEGTGCGREREEETRTEWVVGVTQRVVFRCWLWEPDVSAIATKVA
jgi:hypothetical protein